MCYCLPPALSLANKSDCLEGIRYRTPHAMKGAVYEQCLLFMTIVETLAVISINTIMILMFLRHQQLLSAMNLYICSMCISGLISGILAPFGIGPYVGPYTYVGVFSANPCVGQKWKAVVFYAAAFNNILCMLAIAVERWRSLSSSTRHNSSCKIARIVTSILWIVSALYAVILFQKSSYPLPITVSFGSPSEPFVPERQNLSSTATNLSSTETFEFVTSATNQTNFQIITCFSQKRTLVLIIASVTFAVSYLVPLLIMAVIYSRLILRLMADMRRAASRANSLQRAKFRAVQAMILVVIIFATCWLPGQGLQIWLASHTTDYIRSKSHVSIIEKLVVDFGTHFAIWNHWIHALVYPLYSRQITYALRETVSFIFCFGSMTCLRPSTANSSIVASPDG